MLTPCICLHGVYKDNVTFFLQISVQKVYLSMEILAIITELSLGVQIPAT